ncbi:hypothetical protein [Nonomuraea sp. NPDC049646]|uniref:hypothetical protein n=1 Tax=unclassified Nonomuraea TaxID=2593643 RepID=UPI0037904A15
MTTPEARVRPAKYWVSCLPDTHKMASAFTIVVKYVPHYDGWALIHRGTHLDRDGVPSWGPSWPGDDKEPETEEEERAAEEARKAWAAEHYFPHDTALELARTLAPGVEVASWTATMVAARDAEQAAGPDTAP